MPRVNKMLLVKFFLLFSFLVNLAVFLQLGFFYGFGVEIFTVRARIGENGVNIFNPIGVSKEGANLAIFSLFFLLFKKHRLFRRSKIILLLTFMLGLLNLLLGASRGPTASFLLVVISMVLYNLYVARKSLRYMFNVSAVMGGIAFVIMQYVIPAINNGAFSLAKRVAQATDKGFGEEVRAYQWRAAWEQIKSSPIWGERMVENYLNHSPHNLYIEIMLATGIVGTLVFLFSVAVFARKFISALIVQDIMLVFFFLATAQFLFGLSGLSIPTGWHFWSFLALCLTFSTKRSDHNYA
jgi:O-antigen ligase